MTITAKRLTTATRATRATRYNRPGLLTSEQIAVTLLVTLLACAVASVAGLVVGAIMAVALMVSNFSLCATIDDIEREEEEEGQR